MKVWRTRRAAALQEPGEPVGTRFHALPTRLVVFLITWFAKVQGYDTHYVKFGPPGIERDLPETLLATALAQGGFWVPFTVVCGVAIGVWFARGRTA